MLSPADCAIVHRDTAIPGLALLLDPAAMLELLRRATRATDVEAVAARYVRYKPGTSALVAYDVQVGGTPVVVHARAHATTGRGPAGKLAKGGERVVVASPLGFGRVVLPEVAVAVSSFPNDDKVRGLVAVALADSRRSLIGRAVNSHAGLGDAELVALAYKPERRFVGALAIDGRPVAVVRVQARGTPPAPVLPAATRLLRLPRVLGRRAWRGITITNWIEGETFTTLAARGDGRAVAGDIGKALATLHASPAAGLPESRVADQRGALDAAACLLSTILPDLGPAAADLMTRIAERLRSPRRFVTLHGDLHPGQLVVDETGVGLIDLDEVCSGAAVSDLASLAAGLLALATTGQVAVATARHLCDDVVEGYAREAGGVPAGLDTWVAAHLLRRAPQAFRERHAAWPDVAARTLDLARAMLDAPPWPEWRGAATRPNPMDPALPAIGPASEPKHVEQVLSALPGDAWRHVRVRDIRLIRHKPGRRCLLEYDLAGLRPRPDHILTVVAKMRTRGADTRTAELMSHLWHGVFAPDSPHGASVPQPLGVVPALSSWLQARVPGAPATEWAFGAEGVPVMRRAAAALRLLHTSGVPAHRCHGVADELSALQPRIARLAQARPGLATRAERLLEACAAHLEGLPDPTDVLLHRDLHPDHLLWTGARLYLIDFDLAASGDAAVDVGNLVAHLIELGLRLYQDASRLQPVADAFVDAYLCDAADVTSPAVDAWTTAALVRLATLSIELPGRGHTTDALMALCERRFDVAAASPHAPALHALENTR